MRALAKLHLVAGDPAKAVGEFQKALAITPADAELHFDRGLALGRLGDLNGAAAEFRRAIALRPAFAAAHFN